MHLRPGVARNAGWPSPSVLPRKPILAGAPCLPSLPPRPGERVHAAAGATSATGPPPGTPRTGLGPWEAGRPGGPLWAGSTSSPWLPRGTWEAEIRCSKLSFDLIYQAGRVSLEVPWGPAGRARTGKLLVARKSRIRLPSQSGRGREERPWAVGRGDREALGPRGRRVCRASRSNLVGPSAPEGNSLSNIPPYTAKGHPGTIDLVVTLLFVRKFGVTRSIFGCACASSS